MKPKTITILFVILLSYGILAIFLEILKVLMTYRQFASIHPLAVEHYKSSGMWWKHLFFNLPMPAFSCALAFFIKKERFNQTRRKIIKYSMYITSAWWLVVIFAFIMAVVFNIEILR